MNTFKKIICLLSFAGIGAAIIFGILHKPGHATIALVITAAIGFAALLFVLIAEGQSGRR